MSTSRRHKSKQDFKNLRRANAVKKLGGQGEAGDILHQWELHSDDTMEMLEKVLMNMLQVKEVLGRTMMIGIQVKVMMVSVSRLIALRGQRMNIVWTFIKMLERGL